jgi:hypothetical protein
VAALFGEDAVGAWNLFLLYMACSSVESSFAHPPFPENTVYGAACLLSSFFLTKGSPFI